MIIEGKGNIFSKMAKDVSIVIPTNIGWKSDGSNVMGAGMAKEALARSPGIDDIYGSFCYANRDKVPFPIFPLFNPAGNMNFTLLATKPLNPTHPELSWQSNASLALVESGVQQLRDFNWSAGGIKEIYLPLLGCGNGNLNKLEVLNLLINKLDNRFHLMDHNPLT